MGVALERLLAPVPGTRSVYYERNTGGLYLDIYPNREALARRGLTVGDVQRTIEAAIGGAPVTTTVEGRARFSISVRYPQDLRSDVERLKQMLVPLPGASGRGGDGGGGMGGSGDATPARIPELLLAQGMGGASAPPGRPSGGSKGAIGDAPTLDWSQSLPRVQDLPLGARGQPTGATVGSAGFVPLGQVADIRIVGGPPMLRDEGGLLVGYVYVDVDPSVDIGGYVDRAKLDVAAATANGKFAVPPGYFLKWTGQYELQAYLEQRTGADDAGAIGERLADLRRAAGTPRLH